MNHTCKCICGNISCCGRVLRSVELANIVDDFQKIHGSKCCNFLMIHDGSISIKNQLSIQVVKDQSDCMDILCRDCKQVLSIKHVHKYFVAILSTNGIPNNRRISSPAGGSPFQVIDSSKFSRFFTVTGYDEGGIIDLTDEANSDDSNSLLDQFEDADFELMFSANTTPFVGSFRDNFFYNGSSPLLV